MDDKRLIDANALDVIRFTPTGGELLDATERGWNECISFLETKAKTIDAVEVVRCRECKHSRPLTKGLVACLRWNRAFICDGFCHDGAKMDANDNNVGHKDGGEPDGNPH